MLTNILVLKVLIRGTFREWVENNPNKVIPVAFDMEWPFSFKTGSGKAALIQICKDINECHLFQISCLTSIPKPLVTFLSHERVCLHGVNIKKYNNQMWN